LADRWWKIYSASLPLSAIPNTVGVNSGTDALRFAFMAAGIGEGDIIVTVPRTFIATAEAISQAGAQIAFIDINESTHTIDPENFANIWKRTVILTARPKAY
jgi:dTDP-4-amino-4,6-dideoxygalactose transaminase